jgi:osteoclast-associated immunoglobulin-like receptor
VAMDLTVSISPLPLESVPLDYTQGNLIRLGLASLVLILLGALVAFDWRRRNGTLGDILPPGNWM